MASDESEARVERGRRRWVRWALGLYLLFAAAVLLSPIRFGAVSTAIVDWLNGELGVGFVRAGMIEFGANILFFVPFGFLLCLWMRRYWLGLTLALVLSASAELVQLVLPARVASARDVLANVFGAALGGLIALAFTRTSSRARPSSADDLDPPPTARPAP